MFLKNYLVQALHKNVSTLEICCVYVIIFLDVNAIFWLEFQLLICCYLVVQQINRVFALKFFTFSKYFKIVFMNVSISVLVLTWELMLYKLQCNVRDYRKYEM